MAERKATNKYYPPDWDPSKGSINTYQNAHPLRDRARKLDQGILIVRFEMPWNAWCLHCNIHIGQGIRYNAEKKKVDMYYTTPIFSFRMRCRSCSGWMEIRTDPKASDFTCIEGVKKKAEEFLSDDEADAAEAAAVDRVKLADNPLYKLEIDEEHLAKAEQAKHHLTALYDANAQTWSDPYTMSQRLRRSFRDRKKVEKAEEASNKAFAEAKSLSIPILSESKEDAEAAKRIKFDDSEKRLSRRKVSQKQLFKRPAKVPKRFLPSLRQAAVASSIPETMASAAFTQQSLAQKIVRREPQPTTSNANAAVNTAGLVEYDSHEDD